MQRFYEIDWVRGVAIVAMVVFHAGFDMNFFTNFSIDVDHGVWRFMALFVQIIFVGTTGITLAISCAGSRSTAVISRLKHAAFVFGWGIVITLVTWVLFREQAVWFGILHFLGVSMVLALPFVKFGEWNALLGLGVFGLAWVFRGTVIDSLLGIPLGFKDDALQSLDYFPLFPWFGLFLLGVAVGSVLVKKPWHFLNGRGFFVWMGQHSLIIYLVHQPVLVGLIWLAGEMVRS